MFRRFRRPGTGLLKMRPRAQAILSRLLRVLGLRSLIYLFRHLFRSLRHKIDNRHEAETPKHVLYRSRVHAIFHSVIHLFPMAIFISILLINYSVVYEGPGLSLFKKSDAAYFALFQVAAKLVELICLASLCTILLETLRSDLLHGEGVSLGLLTSASWLASPIYLLSPEYISAVQISIAGWWQLLGNLNTKHGIDRRTTAVCWRRSRLVVLLLLLMPIAALVGPSSAVLLIPRNQIFPAGGLTYYLNATFEEMWPGVVSSNAELALCSEPNATLYPVCPSGGYQSFRYQCGYNGIYDTGLFQPSQTADSSIYFTSSLILDPLEIAPAVLSSGVDRLGAHPWMPTYAIQPNLYTAVLQQVFFRDWMSALLDHGSTEGFSHSIRNYQYATAIDASATSMHPITHVRCSLPQNISSQAEIVEFQYVQSQPLSGVGEVGWSQDNVTRPVSIKALNRNRTSHVRTQWIPLPLEDFGPPVSIGMLFELPWSSSGNDSSRLAIGCTVAAAWGQGLHSRSETSNYQAWEVNPREKASDAYDRNIIVDAGDADLKNAKVNRHVKLTMDWLELLTPIAPDPPQTADAWRPTTLENIFHAAGFDTLMHDLRFQEAYIGLSGGGCGFGTFDPNLTDVELWDQPVCSKEKKMSFVERTLARLVTDGLSRRLSYQAFVMLPNLRSWIPFDESRNEDYNLKLLLGKDNPIDNAVILPDDPTLVTQRMEVAVHGYGYNASTQTDYLATLVIAVYLLLATIAVLWAIFYKPVTSNSWDSMLELLLLAFNSAPEPALRGTSAEIGRWDTYKQTVMVRAEQLAPLASGTKPDHTVREPELGLRLLVKPLPAQPKLVPQLGPSSRTLLDPERNGQTSQTGSAPSTLDVDAESQSSNAGLQSGANSLGYLIVEVGKKYY